MVLIYCKFINFAGINVCVFETKPCSQGLKFVISSGLVNYLGAGIIFVGIYCDLKVS